MTSFISFAHRRNLDASIDSICTRCYQTIASADTYPELTTVEEKHQCDMAGEFNHSFWKHDGMAPGILTALPRGSAR